MPGLDNESIRRLRRVVNRSEADLPLEGASTDALSPVESPFQFRRYELKDNLTSDDNSATAYLLPRPTTLPTPPRPTIALTASTGIIIPELSIRWLGVRAPSPSLQKAR